MSVCRVMGGHTFGTYASISSDLMHLKSRKNAQNALLDVPDHVYLDAEVI